MSAWSPLIMLMAICAKCAIDLIGLEYSSRNQCLTDTQFFYIMIFCIAFALSIDVLNWKGRRGNNERRTFSEKTQ